MTFKNGKDERTQHFGDKKKIFFTSDWHIGHAQSIEFDKRPFKDLNHMHRVLINTYNSTVPENGLCYFLGDVGLAGKGILSKVISELNGTKVLVIGNHDKGVNAMYNMGFDVVVQGLVLYVADARVTVSHCPLRGVRREYTQGMRGSSEIENWHGELRKKHARLTFSDEGQYHLHGHIHSREGKDKSQKILGKQFDVGVPANNYGPVNISVIENWIVSLRKREIK